MPLYIYALIDPDTGETRYVGKATIPESRLQGHVFTSCTPWVQENVEKGAWIRELAGRGKVPITKILETVTEENWQARECYWIAHCKSSGNRLTNRKPGGISRFAAGSHKGVHVLLPAADYNALKTLADARAVSISALVREMVSGCLKATEVACGEAAV